MPAPVSVAAALLAETTVGTVRLGVGFEVHGETFRQPGGALAVAAVVRAVRPIRLRNAVAEVRQV